MTEVFSIDAETSSYVNLQTQGAYRYTHDPRTRCLMLAYHPVGRPDKPALWLEGDPVPYAIRGHIANGGSFAGWNVTFFDRWVWSAILVPQHGFPPIDDDCWRDSMHLAAAANLPRSLDGCGAAVGVPFNTELKDSNRIRRITDALRTPLPATIAEILSEPWAIEPNLVAAVLAAPGKHDRDLVARVRALAPRFDVHLTLDLRWLANRCVQDVELEEQVLMRLPPWPDVEPWIRMPAIDRRINDRGILVDSALVDGLAKAAAAELRRLNSEMARLTADEVDSTTKIEPLKRWLVARGVDLPLPTAQETDAADEAEDDEVVAKGSPWRLRKTDIADILARNNVPDECRYALTLRTEAAKASVRKLHAMQMFAGNNGRLSGLLKLLGAQQTGRYSSGGPQFHNLVRDVFANPDEIAEANGLDVKKHKERVAYLQAMALSTGIIAGTEGDLDTLRCLYEHEVKDAQGRTSIAGVMTWISRMLRRLVAARYGHILLNGDYSSAQARITAWLAQQIDVLEAYRRGEDVYRFTAAGMYHTLPELVTKLQRQAGKTAILAGGFGGGPLALLRMAYAYGMLLSLEEATDIIKKFRETNAMTRAYWYATDDAAANAVRHPGQEFPVAPLGIIAYFMAKDGADCLCCRLPSGRLLRYWAPRLHQDYWGDGRLKDRQSLTYLAIKGRAVLRRSAYHTILTANQVQGIEADMLAVTLANTDEAGIPVVLHVHDNAAAEVPENEVDSLLPTFKQCMLQMPQWTAGLPIAVDVEVSARFG